MLAVEKRLLDDIKRTRIYLIKKEKIIHSVGHSERTDVMVEPYLSKQWFVKMDVFSRQRVLRKSRRYKDTKINFVPKRFEKSIKSLDGNNL